MNPLFQLAGNLIVSSSVGLVAGTVIKGTLPIGSSLIKKASYGLGVFVLSEMIGSKAADYVDENIEAFLKVPNAVRETLKNAKEAQENKDAVPSETVDEEKEKKEESDGSN